MLANINTSLSSINTQLGQKLQASNLSLAQNGYIQLTNHLIIQWGRLDKTSNNVQDMTVTFPVAFSTLYTVVCTWYNTQDNNTKEWNIRSYSNTQFTIHKNSGQTNGNRLGWIAIGYK